MYVRSWICWEARGRWHEQHPPTGSRVNHGCKSQLCRVPHGTLSVFPRKPGVVLCNMLLTTPILQVCCEIHRRDTGFGWPWKRGGGSILAGCTCDCGRFCRLQLSQQGDAASFTPQMWASICGPLAGGREGSSKPHRECFCPSSWWEMCLSHGTNENMMLGGAKHSGSNKVGRGICNAEGWVGREGAIYNVRSGKSFLLWPLKGGGDGSHAESQEKNIYSKGNRNTERGGRVGSVPRKHTVWPVWLEGSLERSPCPHLNVKLI